MQFVVSKQTLNRFFNSHFGLPFGKYLQEKRFEVFEENLVSTEESINSLVYEAGFKNINSFNRLFKSKYGESPHVWRENHRRERTEPEKVENSLVDEDFFELQQKSEFNYIIGNQVWITNQQKMIWSISHPSDLLGPVAQEKLDKILEVITISVLRFELDLSKQPSWIYLAVLTECLQRHIHPCLVIQLGNIVEVNKVMSFLKQLILEKRMNFKNWQFEIKFDQELEEWPNEYNRFYSFIKENFLDGQCGIGNVSYQESKETLLARLSLLQSIDFVGITVLPEIDHFSLYSRRNQIVSHSSLSNISAVVSGIIEFLRAHLPMTSLFLSQFGLTGGEKDEINDHIYLASYHLAFVNAFIEMVDGIGGYTLLDSLHKSEGEFVGSPGLVTKSGLLKAPLHALSFQERLYSYILTKEDNFLVSYDGNENYRLLAFQYQPVNDYYSSDKDINIYHHQQNIFNAKNDLIQFEISNVLNGIYKLTYYVLDNDNGSGPEVQRKFTGLDQLDRKMINFLETQYRPRIYQKKISVKDNKIIEKLILKPFEVLFVEIEKEIF
ncbi:helix-turn-helix domain-containing protein [Streptococcus sp. ZJ93]|uniref:helix-turn-helix domain-containing protein n=1 Tax=Streptococcus handemini TaxID=3161188 RepID=UPI0034D69F4E